MLAGTVREKGKGSTRLEVRSTDTHTLVPPCCHQPTAFCTWPWKTVMHCTIKRKNLIWEVISS